MTNKIMLAGDWHGAVHWAESCIRATAAAGADVIYHVGDFGYMGKYKAEYVEKLSAVCRALSVTLLITPGNHEDWDDLDSLFAHFGDEPAPLDSRNMIFMLPRGYRWERAGVTFLSMGGAPSIDYGNRRAHVDWWPTEAITYGDIVRAIEGGPVDIMITHDAPTYAPSKVYDIVYGEYAKSALAWGEATMQYCKQGHELLDELYQTLKPKLLAHGHYHVWEHWESEDQHVLALHKERNRGNLVSIDLDEFREGVVKPESMGKFLYG